MTESQMRAMLAACEADPELMAAVNGAQTVDALIAVAAEHGFTIVPDDLVAPSGEGELSDGDLELSAGGTDWYTRFFCGRPVTVSYVQNC